MSTTSDALGIAGFCKAACIAFALLVGLCGCRITTERGTILVRPGQRPPSLLIPARYLGEHCVENRCFDLLDADGDGSPDFARDPGSNRWYPIKAPMAGEVGGSMNLASLHTIAGSHHNADTGDGDSSGEGGGESTSHLSREWEWWRAGLNDRIRWDFELAEPYDFGGASTETIIAEKGLDIPPGMTASTTALSVELFDTESFYTEATLFWTSAFEMPLNFNDLSGQITVLESEDPQGPNLYAIQLRGDIRDVARVLLDVQDEECTQILYHFESGGAAWCVESDVIARTLTLYAEGVFVTTISID